MELVRNLILNLIMMMLIGMVVLLSKTETSLEVRVVVCLGGLLSSAVMLMIEKFSSKEDLLSMRGNLIWPDHWKLEGTLLLLIL